MWSGWAYTLGLSAFMLIKVLAPGYYARQDMKSPVRIGIIAMVANMVMNPLFIFPLMWWFDLGHVGLAVATSLSAWLNAGLLYRGLNREGVLRVPDDGSGYGLMLMIGLGTMGFVLWLLTPELSWWLNGGMTERVVAMSGLVVAGVLAYVLPLYAMGLRLHQFRSPNQ